MVLRPSSPWLALLASAALSGALMACGDSATNTVASAGVGGATNVGGNGAGGAGTSGTSGASAAGAAAQGGSGAGGGTNGGASGTGGAAAAGAGGAAGAAASSGAAGTNEAGGAGAMAGAAGSAGAGGDAAGAGMGGASAGASGSAGAGGMAGAAGAGMPADPVFTTNIRLNDDNGRARQAEVAMAAGPDGLVMAGWMDERAERVCAFTVSTDRGDSWSTNVSIAVTQGGFVGDPAVGIDGGGTLYAGCQDYGQNQIKLMTSSDKGMNWSTPRLIQDAPDKPWLGGGVADGIVFVSWLGQNAGIKRSRDHGATWDPIEPLGNIIHGTAIVASTSGLVHVPYNLDSARNQLRYVRSKDGGDSYEAPRDLVSNMGTFGFNAMPRQHPIVGAASDPTGRVVAITWSSQMPGGQAQEDVLVALLGRRRRHLDAAHPRQRQHTGLAPVPAVGRDRRARARARRVDGSARRRPEQDVLRTLR